MKLEDLGADILTFILNKSDQKSILSCFIVNRYLRKLIKCRDILFVKIYECYFKADEAVSELYNKSRSISLS